MIVVSEMWRSVGIFRGLGYELETAGWEVKCGFGDEGYVVAPLGGVWDFGHDCLLWEVVMGGMRIVGAGWK